MKSAYRDHPLDTERMPPGILHIIGNEGAERFSFYGMRTILVTFMTVFLLNRAGEKSVMSAEEAKGWFHLFVSAVYFFPLLGAFLSDAIWGKYATIMRLSVVYCLGHLTLALDDTQLGLSVGLTLIAVGSGGIKPCVSAHVGDQFGGQNQHLRERVFSWFYLAINAGALISTLWTPWLLENHGSAWAFGVPGIAMALATIVFWMGRNKFAHIRPGGMTFLKEIFSREGLSALGRLGAVYAFVAVFWSLYDQSGSAWVLQADKMDLYFAGITWLPAQVQAINPVLILVLTPLFAMWIYPKAEKVVHLTPLRKIGAGFVLIAVAFVLSAHIEVMLARGEYPSIAWQLLAFVVLTAAEVLVSITCLDFSYTQAPKKIKSFVMALFLLSVSLGNAFTSGVNFFILNDPPSFKPDMYGKYVLRLTADDGRSNTSKDVTIFVTSEKPKGEKQEQKKGPKPPTATVSHMKAVKPGQFVRLYGSCDKGDAKKEKMALSWALLRKPSDSRLTQAALNVSGDNRSVAFMPDTVGEFELEFSCLVGRATSKARVLVPGTFDNLTPVVNAGEDQTVVVKSWKKFADTTVVLDGSGSFDPNGDLLKYHWFFLSVPAGSNVGENNLAGQFVAAQTSKLEGSSYYVFFLVLMLAVTIIFVPVARAFKERNYIQGK